MIHGTDVIGIYGISETVALEVLAETGTNLSKWNTEQKYVSWLNLCPNRKISGGKLISSKRLKKKPNVAAQAFRMAANSLMASNNSVWSGIFESVSASFLFTSLILFGPSIQKFFNSLRKSIDQ